MSQTGYVLIDHFAVALERRRRPELAGQALVLGGHAYERKNVYDLSAESAAMGVRAGLPLRQAEQLCPSAVFLPVDHSLYQEANEAFLAMLERFSPAVAPDLPGSAYFDALGLDRLLASQGGVARAIFAAVECHLGLSSRIALGPTRFTALVAARLAEPGSPLVVSDAAELLGDLPVEYLAGDGELYDRLHLLGIATIGQFMRLPRSELREQFGPVGLSAYDLAAGNGDLPILPRAQPAVLRRRQEFEPEIQDGAALARAIQRISGRLARDLRERYQACQTLILRLTLPNGEGIEKTAQLKEPTAESGPILAMALRLAEQLYSTKIKDAADEVDGGGLRIGAAELLATGLIPEGGRQLSLFDAQIQKRAALDRAASEVERRFGNRLKRAERAPSTSAAILPPFLLRDWSMP